jgi:hypothetical protein
MKPFDLEAAKLGEPIAYVSGTCNDPVNFIGVTSHGEIVVEYIGGTVGVVNPKYIFMAEPERPQWQQDLIDAAKSGMVVEYKPKAGDWGRSSLNEQLDYYHFWHRTEDQFRIRPEKVTRYLWARLIEGEWVMPGLYQSETELKERNTNNYDLKRLDWSAVEFDE